MAPVAAPDLDPVVGSGAAGPEVVAGEFGGGALLLGEPRGEVGDALVVVRQQRPEHGHRVDGDLGRGVEQAERGAVSARVGDPLGGQIHPAAGEVSVPSDVAVNPAAIREATEAAGCDTAAR